VDNAALQYSPDAPAITGPALEKLLHQYQDALDQVVHLNQRCDQAVWLAMLEHASLEPELWTDPEAMQTWLDALAKRLANEGLGKPHFRFEYRAQVGDQPPAIVVIRSQHGLEHTWVLSRPFFEGPDFAPIMTISRELSGLIQEGAEVRRGNGSRGIVQFADARQWLMDEAKKGRSIQRFKGLGEMNPEQLWETTVNPDTRRMLQVGI